MGFAARVKDFIFQPPAEYREEEFFEEYVDDSFGGGYGYGDEPTTLRSGERRPDRAGDTVVLSKKTPVKTGGEIYNMPGMKENHIVISCPENIHTASGISDLLKQGKTVIVKMEEVEVAEAQRVMDFLSGVVHCINGEVHEITNRIFVVAPKNTEVTEHLKEHLKANGIFSGFRASVRNA